MSRAMTAMPAALANFFRSSPCQNCQAGCPFRSAGENTTSLPAICASVSPAAALSPIRPA